MWSQHLKRNPWALPLAGLIIGLEWACRWPGTLPANIWIIPWVLLAWIFLLHKKMRPCLRGILLFWIFLLLGLIRMGPVLGQQILPTYLQVGISTQKEWSILFEATERCQQDSTQQRFVGRLLGVYLPDGFRPLDLPVKWKISGTPCPIRPGLRYRSLAKLRRPKSWGNPTAPDQAMTLRRQGISLLGYLKSPDWLLPVAGKGRRVDQVHRWWWKKMDAYSFPPQVLGLWSALILKDKNPLPDQTQNDFQRAGLSHVLVVSGLHFGMFFGGIYFFGRLCGLMWSRALQRGQIRTLAIGLAAAGSLGYAWLVGGGPSVYRALFGILLFSLVVLWSLSRRPFLLLTAVATLLFLWRPTLWWSLGCRLSFFAVAMLLAWQQWMQPWLQPHDQKVQRHTGYYFKKILGTVGASLLLTLGLFPLIHSFFPYISWVAPVANLLVVPVITLMLLPGLLLLSGLEIFGLGALLARAMASLSEALLQIVHLMAHIPGAIQMTGNWPPWLWGFYGCGICILFLGPEDFRDRRVIRWATLWALVAVLGLGPGVRPKDTLRVTWFDVGQGESILVTVPDGRSLLIDGGGFTFGNMDVGQRILLPELLLRRIFKLDAILLTHPDADHLLGFISLVRQIPVKEFWASDFTKAKSGLKILTDYLVSEGTSLRRVSSGQVFNWGEVELQFLWPPPQSHPQKTKNDASVVFRLCYSKVCGLLVGDLEANGERALLASQVDLRAHWLKLGHHGSRTSTSAAFLDRIKPKLAIVSLGSGNRFGFPHAEVVQRLREREIIFLRTDRHGQIELQITQGEIYYGAFKGF